MTGTGERCALCERDDVDERWVWLTAARLHPVVDCEYDETELVFCSRQHAGEYLLDHELEWPPVAAADRRAGTRVDLYFMGCGLLAIILSVIGLVALAQWLF